MQKLSSVSQKEKAANTRSLEVRASRALLQLEFVFEESVVGQALRLPHSKTATGAVALQFCRRDVDLEVKVGDLLRSFGFNERVRVEWNPRLKSCAGRADFRERLISLNQRLRDHPGEIDRTLRHELAHLLAQFRAKRHRILPHGVEWREACRDLGIGDEKRCHTLPFPTTERIRRFLYRCPNCKRDFPRVRRVRRAVACLQCCRAHNRGKFDLRFRLVLVNRPLRRAMPN